MSVPKRETGGIKADIRQLLDDCGLPSDEKTLSRLQHFLVMKKDDQEVVGIVGLQSLPPVAVIHSLAVHVSYRRQGLASQLLEEIEVDARGAGYVKLYLAATTDIDFFSHRGYRMLAVSDLPASLLTAENDVLPPGAGQVVYMGKDL